jgi:fructokinase
MANREHKIVGLGELLWDLLPRGKQLGGAPANFAYITNLLGDEGIAASRVGSDLLGAEALQCLRHLGLTTACIQTDSIHSTGTVKVEIDSGGQPRFEVSSLVAWDFLEWTPEWQELAEHTQAVCFGSLAQRSEPSRSTIRKFLHATGHEAVRIFDVNLRQTFYTAEILAASMNLATIVKLNHEELPRLMHMLARPHQDEEGSARCLLSLYDLELVCVTRGNGGSLLVSKDESSAHSGFRVKVADTVGAGDAFTAALVHEFLRGASLDRINETANRVGAWVASEVGATPMLNTGGLEATLSRVG